MHPVANLYETGFSL